MAMHFRSAAVAAFLALSFPFNASAWWDEGHMQIAAVAYERLSPQIREKADALIRLNPEYESWVAGVPERLRPQYAFVRAAVWADDIKGQVTGYTDEGDTPDSPTAGRNIGYGDSFKHGYWHYKDMMQQPDKIIRANAVGQTGRGRETFGERDDLSFEVDRVGFPFGHPFHVGDAHQPLHATALFSKALKKGDQGGNLIEVTPADGQTVKLHAYWDGIFGGYSTPFGAIRNGLLDKNIKLPEPDQTRAAISDPAEWLRESRQKAIEFVYVAPVGYEKGPYELDRSYETRARILAREQAAVAAARLANLISEALK
ncbi:S1/P1 nuclease [Rhizobium mongolense]|uniref:S1/P1 nuclease n=1 Tax=Rhizobium mongolense TaxID=57676 RepID=UPI0034A404E4